MNGLASDGLPSLRNVVERFALEPKKSLGQNFLFDLNLTGKVARAAGPLEGVTVFEVGPGPGGLTRALLTQGARVTAVERDERCLDALAEIGSAYPGRLQVIQGNALSVDPAVSAGADEPLRIVANLPYNVGTALLTRWIERPIWPPRWDRMILMFQREVAERIVATPRDRAAYGRLAVLCGWRNKARILFNVPATAFTPPPKVTSAVVELIPRTDPLPCSARHLAIVTQAAFGQRRKMLRQSLRSLPTHKGVEPMPLQLLERAEIDPTLRAEEVDIAGFVRLTRTWLAMIGEVDLELGSV